MKLLSMRRMLWLRCAVALSLVFALLLPAAPAAAQDAAPAETPAAETPAAETPAAETPAERTGPPVTVPAGDANLACLDPQAQATAAQFANLHVPSPAWEDQIIYFVMTDRFADGDPTNNDSGAGEYDPQDFSKFNGGDLQGVIDQLDYIQGLGATAVWVTPPVSNQWWDPIVQFGGYHGYWAEDFTATDPHFGSVQTYQALSDALHGREMYLIQDIVANHTGNFFSYLDESGKTNFDPDDPTQGVQGNPLSVPVTKPRQEPFDQNDVTDPAQREAAIYHWTPTIIDTGNITQQLTYQLSDLDDLNTTNEVVRGALKQSYACWIQNVGVDGFRIDTVKYVEHDFWHDFVYAEDAAAPGMAAVAAATGRDAFLTFGEAFVDSDPLDPAGDILAGSFTGTAEKPELDGAINFPMHWTIGRVFAEGQPTNFATYSLQMAQDPTIYRNPLLNVNFVDNHDVARFLSRGSVAGLKQAMLFMLTIPGLPVIYYGTEQGFSETRAAMFAEGWASGGVDHYDTGSELYRHIQALTALRKSSPLYSRGTLTPLADNPAGPGVLAYARELNAERVFVLFNTADQPVLLTELDTGLPEGTVLKLLFGIDNQDDIVVGPQGKVTMELAAREGMVLQPSEEVRALAAGDDASVTVDESFAAEVLTEDFAVTGAITGTDAAAGAAVKVIVNGSLGTALETTADARGQFTVTAPIAVYPPGQVANSLLAYVPDLMVVSAAAAYTTEVTSTDARTTVFDWVGDDVGSQGTYSKPTDETFGGQMDILATEAAAYGSNLQVTLTMSDVTDVWAPRNGFDHVLFQIFIDVPGPEGVTVLPTLNASAPQGMAWDYVTFAEGWSNRFSAATGALTDTFGTAVTPAPAITVDEAAKTVTFLYPAAAFGNLASLAGTKVYVTTWDWNGPDNALRPLKELASQWVFGGGDGTVDPIILDDTSVVQVGAATQLVTDDPPHDDFGLYDPRTATGPYTLPADAAFSGTLDLGPVVAAIAPQTLTVSMQMEALTNTLEAPHGFDHVRFHVFLDLPETEGAQVAPSLNLTMPQGFTYDFVAAVDGWNSTLYAADGAGEASLGTAAAAGPGVSVTGNTVTLDFPRAAIGAPEDLGGLKVYVATWDWDEEAQALRGLTPSASATTFGGGDAATDPLVIDDVLVGAASRYRSPFAPAPQVDVTLAVTVPPGTPADADLYLTGAFNNWAPADVTYQFEQGADEVYRFTLPVAAGATVEYRITRGSFANAEKLDPNNRVANRTYTAPAEDLSPVTEVIDVAGWWDQ